MADLSAEELELLEQRNELILEELRTGKKGIESKIKLYLEETKLGRGMDSLGKSTKTAADGFTSSLSSMAKGTGDFNDSTALISNSIKSVSGLFSSIPVLGPMITNLGAAAADLMSYTIGRTQAGYDSYQQLAAAGLIAEEGVTGLKNNLDAAGIPLATYSKILLENSEKLAYFGGSATAGAKEFNAVMKLMQDEGDMRMRNLGFSLEEMGDTVIEFQKRSQRLGFMQEMSARQLQDATAKYASELDMVAKLTGKQRQAIEKEREDLMNDDQFRAMLNEMPGVNPEDQTLMMDTINSFGDQTSKAFKQIMASGTFLGDEAQAAVRQGTLGQDILAMRKDFLAGNLTVAEVIDKMSRSAERNNMVFNKYNTLGLEAIGMRQAELTDLARRETLNKEQEAELVDLQKRQIAGEDAATNVLNKSMARSQKVGATMDGFAIASKPAIAALNAFTDVMLESVNLLKENFGGAKPRRTAAPREVTSDMRESTIEDLKDEIGNLGESIAKDKTYGDRFSGKIAAQEAEIAAKQMQIEKLEKGGISNKDEREANDARITLANDAKAQREVFKEHTDVIAAMTAELNSDTWMPQSISRARLTGAITGLKNTETRIAKTDMELAELKEASLPYVTDASKLKAELKAMKDEAKLMEGEYAASRGGTTEREQEAIDANERLINAMIKKINELISATETEGRKNRDTMSGIGH